MKCPACREVDSVTADRHGVEIDYCPQCRGVWLDQGELDKIIDRIVGVLAPASTVGEQYRVESFKRKNNLWGSNENRFNRVFLVLICALVVLVVILE